MKIQKLPTLPTVEDVISWKNWTGHSLAELVEFGRVTPKSGANDWVRMFEIEQAKTGARVAISDLKEYISKWECLEGKVFAELVAIREANR